MKFNIEAKRMNTDHYDYHTGVDSSQIDFVRLTFHYNNAFPVQPIRNIEKADERYDLAFSAYCDRFGTASE